MLCVSFRPLGEMTKLAGEMMRRFFEDFENPMSSGGITILVANSALASPHETP